LLPFQTRVLPVKAVVLQPSWRYPVGKNKQEVTGMSDALTNREIEDVLTSVRRLVGQDVRRTEGEKSGTGKTEGAKVDGGRLVLTQAQRIDAVQASEPGGVSTAVNAPQAPVNAPQQNPPMPGMLSPAPPLPPAPDFRRLEATIAELEAAVSASGSVFEPDGSETHPASNVTALYATPSFVRNTPQEVAAAKPAPGLTRDTEPQPEAQPEPVTTGGDDPDDDDALFETVIDEATLRVLVAQIVREELQGQLGERVTLQVRKLVRSEIAKALDSRDLI